MQRIMLKQCGDVKPKYSRRFCISTGKQYSVRDFAKAAFKTVNLDYKKYIKIDKRLERPAEVQTLLGSCSKAKEFLNGSNIIFKHS